LPLARAHAMVPPALRRPGTAAAAAAAGAAGIAAAWNYTDGSRTLSARSALLYRASGLAAGRAPTFAAAGGAAACEESAGVRPIRATDGSSISSPATASSSAAAKGLERLTLRSVARCVSAEFKTPREMTSRVRQDCGEDAFFLAAPTPSSASVGIADGVGGWAGQGVDPALFAWELMNRCQDVAERGDDDAVAPPPSPSWTRPLPSIRLLASALPSAGDSGSAAAVAGQPVGKEGERVDPKRLLSSGFELLRNSADGPPCGSSTACVASLDRLSGELRVANLGDSGALLVRGSSGACVLESKAQQHRFNCPYQLMVAPEGLGGGDPPSIADVYAARVEAGDLLVLATDGLLDNVSTEQAAAIAAAMRSSEPGVIAERLVTLARQRAQGWEDTPFSIAARKHGFHHLGGKPDDITVIVARVEHGGASCDI